ncbi:MAG: hypothetical protein H0U49_01600 [Parachlamydiaceae bacterium]|nr:hypothetical protein [Parachlamydiaceae bacterium]
MFINKVCNALQKARIPYAIVGGYAVALHGIPRGTFDIDFVIQWTLNNLVDAEKAMIGLGLVSRIPVDAQNVFNFRDEYILKRHLIAWNFYDPVNPSHQVDIIINYDLKSSSTKTIKTVYGNLKILSKKDLIAMKKSSGRPQDLEDIKSLEAI